MFIQEHILAKAATPYLATNVRRSADETSELAGRINLKRQFTTPPTHSLVVS